MKQYNYRPLPDSVTISKSSIEGLGLFATQDIDANTCLGISHVFDDRFEDGMIRTPIGGYINSSDTPNCIFKKDDLTYTLHTSEIILKGNELTVDYSLYLCGINFK